MLTGTTLEAVAVLALVAVAHAVVSAFIACRLTRTEQAPAETQGTVLTGNFARRTTSSARRPDHSPLPGPARQTKPLGSLKRSS